VSLFSWKRFLLWLLLREGGGVGILSVIQQGACQSPVRQARTAKHFVILLKYRIESGGWKGREAIPMEKGADMS
jgi:hypothetical protein